MPQIPNNVQAIDLRFGQGVKTKTDPWQIPTGTFISLVNSVFTTGQRLTKRNGYGLFTSPPANSIAYLTTFQDGLVGLGADVEAYDSAIQAWDTIAPLTPIVPSVTPAVRNGLNQTQADSALAPNGLMCVAYTETGSGTTTHKYEVINSLTGQTVILPTAISGADVTYGTPRCFYSGGYFFVLYTGTVSGSTGPLNFLTINVQTLAVVPGSAPITTSYAVSTTLAFDAVALVSGTTGSNNTLLYVAWSQTTSEIRACAITTSLAPTSAVNVDTTNGGTTVTMCADDTVPYIWIVYWNVSAGANVAALTSNLAVYFGPHAFSSGGNSNMTAVVTTTGTATSKITVFSEIPNTYGYDTDVASNFIQSSTVTIKGVVSSSTNIIRSAGLASKAFVQGGNAYFLAAYQNVLNGEVYQNNGNYQPTYFLVNGTSSHQAAPVIAGKIAYGNGGGYLATGLPNAVVSGSSVFIPCLYKDLVAAVNKGTALTSTAQNPVQTAGIYSQTGVNIATFDFVSTGLYSVEMGANLNFISGLTYAYDGQQVTEQGFHIWPDNIEASWSTTGGAIAAQPDGTTNAKAYWYQVTYEWTDNQGLVNRSAPSVPIYVTTTGSGTTGSIAINIPTLRLTAKTATPVNIVIYRWSVAQQIYYQVTSIASPTQNSMSVDYITYTDTLADATILGNNILYTTGGVVEDIGPPAFTAMALFDDRMWGVDAEDGNLLWYSKQVIENTPVEMSDLFTLYVAPSLGAQGATGPLACLFPMDTALVLFKETAMYYINGSGPDNTGANSQYSQPSFITSVVGCTNQKSIVFTPNGLMFEFQSESGNQIWLLGRDLQTNYIGADVETLTKNATVLSAVNIPGANHVRFTLSSGVVLVYDYYYSQWGEFIIGGTVPNVLTAPASSTLYNGLHTFINAQGAVYQETPGVYVDGSSPVLMSFLTGWLNLAGLQGYERIYWLLFLGNYLSPFRLQTTIGYNYNQSPWQQTTILPDNYNPTYGAYPGYYGAETPYGGNEQPFKARVFTQQQRAEAIQIGVQEIYDPSFGVAAGAGLTLSGITLVAGIKSGYRPSAAAKSFG